MAKNSRDKGKRGERELARWLRERGYEEAKRGQQHKGGPGSPDTVGLQGIHIEVKRWKKLNTLDKLKAQHQSEQESGKGEIPVVFYREDYKNWKVVIGINHFAALAWDNTASTHVNYPMELDAEDWLELYKEVMS